MLNRPFYDSLDEHQQQVVREIADAARHEMSNFIDDNGRDIRPLNNDEAGIFDEAVARYWLKSRNREVQA